MTKKFTVLLSLLICMHPHAQINAFDMTGALQKLGKNNGQTITAEEQKMLDEQDKIDFEAFKKDPRSRPFIQQSIVVVQHQTEQVKEALNELENIQTMFFNIEHSFSHEDELSQSKGLKSHIKYKNMQRDIHFAEEQASPEQEQAINEQQQMQFQIAMQTREEMNKNLENKAKQKGIGGWISGTILRERRQEETNYKISQARQQSKQQRH